MMTFNGKVVWITGGSGDIAFATAEQLTELGAKVVLVGRNEKRLKENCRKLSAKNFPGEVQYIVSAPSDYRACVSAAEEIHRMYGRIDILICTHGTQAHRSIDEMTLEEWHHVVDVNLSSVFYVVKAVVPMMKEQHYGRIVLVSSIGGRRGRPGVGVNYAASKAGLVGMTQLLGYELGPWDITVNCVAPGPVATKMLMELPQAHIDRLAAETRIHRLGKVSEIAAAIVYLASEDAGWTTGEVLDVNGGLQY